MALPQCQYYANCSQTQDDNHRANFRHLCRHWNDGKCNQLTNPIHTQRFDHPATSPSFAPPYPMNAGPAPSPYPGAYAPPTYAYNAPTHPTVPFPAYPAALVPSSMTPMPSASSPPPCSQGLHCQQSNDPVHQQYFSHSSEPVLSPQTPYAASAPPMPMYYNPSMPSASPNYMNPAMYANYPPAPQAMVQYNNPVVSSTPPSGAKVCNHGSKCHSLVSATPENLKHRTDFWHPGQPFVIASPSLTSSGGTTGGECKYGALCKQHALVNSSKNGGKPKPADVAHCKAFTHTTLGQLMIEFPKDHPWDIKAITNHSGYDLILLSPKSKEYTGILQHFQKTAPNSVVNIFRVQNYELWRFYFFLRDQIANENGGNPGERLLFHGTDAKLFDSLTKEGFDHRMSANGSLGFGAYFARDANYSLAFAKSFTGTKKMFVARVALGSYTPGTTGLKRPPAKPNGEFFNSVSGGNDSMWCVFDRHQAYPQYIIEYN